MKAKNAAKVEVELIHVYIPRSPALTPSDVQKLALRRDDIATAKREVEVFGLTPVA